MMKEHIVYVLRCADDTLYTGYTVDLPARLDKHNSGQGAKYTRMRTPVVPVYSETFDCKSDALKREYQIKQMSRAQKLALIQTALMNDDCSILLKKK